jgi:glycosyltransferase involved in cell wall biosynthesis
MLCELLDSLARLRVPKDCAVRFLIVENDDRSLSRDTVNRRATADPNALFEHVLETEPGIPFARNRAAKEALGNGDDLLAFVDDDEVVDAEWLARLIYGYRNSDALLLGGPLSIRPIRDGLTWTQRKMYTCLKRRYLKKECRAARRGSLTGAPGVTIVTNNWLGDTRLFSEYGIWFDETMRYTGGTDTKFCGDVRSRQLPIAWVNDAYVYEDIPPERLTFGYQFRRARDQSNTNFGRRLKNNPSARWSGLLSLPLKMLSAAGLAVLLLPTMGRTVFDLARTSGWIAGRIQALRGRESALYVQPTGN